MTYSLGCVYCIYTHLLYAFSFVMYSPGIGIYPPDASPLHYHFRPLGNFVWMLSLPGTRGPHSSSMLVGLFLLGCHCH